MIQFKNCNSHPCFWVIIMNYSQYLIFWNIPFFFPTYHAICGGFLTEYSAIVLIGANILLYG